MSSTNTPRGTDSCVDLRLQGEYHIEARRLGARNLDPQKYARDRDLLLAEVERNPEDGHSVFYLAQTYFDLGDFVNARKWYARRAEMGGIQEAVYYAMYRSRCRCRNSVSRGPTFKTPSCGPGSFDRPAPSRCIRSPLQYRLDQRYRLGYLFAKRAAEIPFPEEDTLFVCDRPLRLARHRRAGGVRVLDRQARRGVHAVAAPAGPTRPPRRSSGKGLRATATFVCRR